MEGEISNFVVVWITILLSLCYCHAIAKFMPKGKLRVFSVLPIVCLFFYLPLNLTTIHLGGVTAFFIAWLANFKLLLFAFNKGPLSSDPPMPLSRFVPMACLPIQDIQSKGSLEKPLKSSLNYATKLMLLVVFVKVYDYSEHLHQGIKLLLYCFHIYFSLEVLLAMFAYLARAVIRVELEPQFNEPHLATSLQDFWGKRWNLMVSAILRPTVYEPVRSASSRVMGRKWTPLPAVFATFLVSGVMHELIFYYIGRVKPTGAATCFFLLHGVCSGAEIAMKKVLNGRFVLPPAMSRPLALGFVLITTFWLFFPPFMKNKPDVKGCTETMAFIEFVMHRRLVSPTDLTCPFL
ncbi:hypothetical protein RJ640_005730 [Escallonia rubra]|uniref:Wax synthase domain-containing protein n=1 Tax=Escallonia rubra TaxID=112253 RepID=A0AA88RWS1_9ASTE|nr:hypothetical protein RJ640_005730 [Escallonia rubra]